jgi:4-amino-4-deoxy-L-arabinose transferase-like glycosyltransferase
MPDVCSVQPEIETPRIPRIRKFVSWLSSISETKWLVFIVMAGLILRLAMAFYLGDTVEIIPVAYDQIHFDNVARSLVAGNGFSFSNPPWPFIKPGAPTAFVSFLYTLFLAGTYWLFGSHALPARIIQALVASLMPWLVYRLVKRILDQDTKQKAVALVAAAITAGYAYFVFFSATLMTEAFYLPAIVWVLLLTHELAEQPTAKLWAVWGLAVSLTCLLRQVFMPITALLFLYILLKARRQVKISHVALAGIIAATLILPWTVRNYMVFDRFLLLNSQAGQTLWNSNHPDLGTEFQRSAMFPIPADLEGLNEVDLDNALLQLAIQNIAANPLRFVLLSISRLAEFFRFWPTPQSSTFNNIARTVSFTVCLPFMVAGLVLSLRQASRWLLLYLFIAAYTLIHVVSWAGIRYRLPVDAALVPFAALAVVALASWLWGRLA